MPTILLSIAKASVLAAFLLLIAVTAVLEYVDMPTPYSPGSSPINPGLFGTSIFVETLRDYGMRVTYVSNWSYANTSITREKVCILVVSPEHDYAHEEVEILVRLLKNSEGVLVIADESTTSNILLEALGLRVKIRGNRLLDEYYNFYPRAVFEVEDVEIALRLDRASEIQNCSTVVGVAESYEYLSTVPELKPVGCVEQLGNLVVLVLGDGSPLSNQAQQLGGSYRELAKYVALVIRKYCGAGCRVLVEAGKYSSNKHLFSRLLDRSESSSFLVLLNDAIHYLNEFEKALKSDPLAGLSEEIAALSIFVAMITISAKLGKRSVELTVSLKGFTWKSREDFNKMYYTVLEILSLLGCDPNLHRDLSYCLENAGYDPKSSSGLVRFMKYSKLALSKGIFSYLPIWRFMVNIALKHSEELLRVLEKRFLREEHAQAR